MASKYKRTKGQPLYRNYIISLQIHKSSVTQQPTLYSTYIWDWFSEIYINFFMVADGTSSFALKHPV